jgi:Abortive infection C-terminus
MSLSADLSDPLARVVCLGLQNHTHNHDHTFEHESSHQYPICVPHQVVGLKMTAPLSESILIAVARLIDDSMAEFKREPTHSDLDFQMGRAGLNTADPKAQGQTVGKAKRVRAVLSWALDNDVAAGGRFVGSLISHIQGCGGFRSDSQNYVGAEAIAVAAHAFQLEGYELTADGELRPLLLSGLAGAAMTNALKGYVRRARKGVMDAALVTGTGKDLLEATAKHVLLERWGTCPETTFPGLLGQAFVAVGLTTPHDAMQKGEPPEKALDRALFDAACAINRLRNKEGTGHGRPWPASITDARAREATELMGIIAQRLLGALDQNDKSAF